MNERLQQLLAIFTRDNALSWLIMIAIALFLSLAIKSLLKKFCGRLKKWAKNTPAQWDDMGVELLERLKPFTVFIWAFFLLTKPLDPPPALHKLILFIVVLTTMVQFLSWGFYLIRTWHDTVLKKKAQDDPSSASVLGLLYTATQTIFITLVVMIGLSNLGIDIGALLAGLGVGGIAVALAAQNILGDLLASLSIVLDKPFVIGDFITAGSEKGTIEQIGIKTTRLRSISGEEIILSNKDLLESRIRNYKRMWRRRVEQRFGLAYSTPASVLERIPGWIKEFVEKHDKLQFDHCHLVQFSPASLDFELVFFVSTPEYNLFMDLQQKLFLDILTKFSQEGIGFSVQAPSPKTEIPPKAS